MRFGLPCRTRPTHSAGTRVEYLPTGPLQQRYGNTKGDLFIYPTQETPWRKLIIVETYFMNRFPNVTYSLYYKSMFVDSAPLVTVIIPAYNAERYLPKCIKSIQSQEYQNIEILIINDGSSDRTEKICRDFSAKDSRVIVVSQQNAGVSAARNQGIHMASGKYIQFVDADDILEPTAIMDLVRCMANTSADAVCFRYWEFSSEDSVDITRNKNSETCKYSILNRQNIMHSIHKGVIKNNVWAFFFNRDFLIRNNLLFDTTIPFGEDILFIYQAASVMTRLTYFPNQLYGYRNNPQSVVHQRSIEYAKSDLDVVMKLDEIQHNAPSLDPTGYLALRIRLLVDAYSMLPPNKITQSEQDVARVIRAECHRIGIARGVRGSGPRYALKFVLVILNLYDFVYAIHSLFANKFRGK